MNTVVLFSIILAASGAVVADYGILSARTGSNETSGSQHEFCLAYNPYFQDLSASQKEAPIYDIADLMPSYGCLALQQDDLAEKIVFLKRGNCSFSEKVFNVNTQNASGLIVVSSEGVFSPSASNESDYSLLNLTVALISSDDYLALKSLGSNIQVQLYQPTESRIDYNLMVIWLLAVATVFIGSAWSGMLRQKQYMRKKLAHRILSRDEATGRPQSDDDETLDISPPFVLVFVVMMVGMLVALYFFYDYLVYAVIGLFCLAACIALHSCLKPVVSKIPLCAKRVPANRIPILSSQPEYRSILLFMVCLGIVVWWAVERKAWYAWILQDILGVVFCIHMMKTIRLPSLKACTILLLLLFVYDIFFVFITPLLTPHHESIMVHVATGQGSKSGEQLPMVLKVPRIIQTNMKVCHIPYSLLGFGDILVPGLLVSYCHGFDLRVKSRGRIYFVSTLIAYGLGLIATFLALIYMETGQPALLYLVPFTLITTVLVSAKRRELRFMWHGEKEHRAEDSDSNTQQVPSNEEPPTLVITSNGNTASINNRRPSPNSDLEPENVRLLSDSG